MAEYPSLATHSQTADPTSQLVICRTDSFKDRSPAIFLAVSYDPSAPTELFHGPLYQITASYDLDELNRASGGKRLALDDLKTLSQLACRSFIDHFTDVNCQAAGQSLESAWCAGTAGDPTEIPYEPTPMLVCASSRFRDSFWENPKVAAIKASTEENALMIGDVAIGVIQPSKIECLASREPVSVYERAHPVGPSVTGGEMERWPNVSVMSQTRLVTDPLGEISNSGFVHSQKYQFYVKTDVEHV